MGWCVCWLLHCWGCPVWVHVGICVYCGYCTAGDIPCGSDYGFGLALDSCLMMLDACWQWDTMSLYCGAGCMVSYVISPSKINSENSLILIWGISGPCSRGDPRSAERPRFCLARVLSLDMIKNTYNMANIISMFFFLREFCPLIWLRIRIIWAVWLPCSPNSACT